MVLGYVSRGLKAVGKNIGYVVASALLLSVSVGDHSGVNSFRMAVNYQPPIYTNNQELPKYAKEPGNNQETIRGITSTEQELEIFAALERSHKFFEDIIASMNSDNWNFVTDEEKQLEYMVDELQSNHP
jgi:hypothetical protein